MSCWVLIYICPRYWCNFTLFYDLGKNAVARTLLGQPFLRGSQILLQGSKPLLPVAPKRPPIFVGVVFIHANDFSCSPSSIVPPALVTRGSIIYHRSNPSSARPTLLNLWWPEVSHTTTFFPVPSSVHSSGGASPCAELLPKLAPSQAVLLANQHSPRVWPLSESKPDHGHLTWPTPKSLICLWHSKCIEGP